MLWWGGGGGGEMNCVPKCKINFAKLGQDADSSKSQREDGYGRRSFQWYRKLICGLNHIMPYPISSNIVHHTRAVIFGYLQKSKKSKL